MVGMSYDDCEEMDYFTSYEQIKGLVEINNRPDIIAKKNIRLALRALNGIQIKYYIRQRESRSKSKSRGGQFDIYNVQAWVEYTDPILYVKPKL
jgi:hypothetical protein